MKKISFLVVLAMLLGLHLQATTWVSHGPGYWDNPIIWQGGVVPPTTNGDTFLIRTPIALRGDIHLTSGAFFVIDSTGGICGHSTFVVPSGATLHSYGVLELDSLVIPGGDVTLFSSSRTILTLYGIISMGGQMTGAGGALSVGPWFNCVQPEYDFTIGTEPPTVPAGLRVFPTITHGDVNVQSDLPLEYLEILNLKGEQVRIFHPQATTFTINTADLHEGVYLLMVRCEGVVIATPKVLVLDSD
jgi:hypothetical protein